MFSRGDASIVANFIAFYRMSFFAFIFCLKLHPFTKQPTGWQVTLRATYYIACVKQPTEKPTTFSASSVLLVDSHFCHVPVSTAHDAS